MNKKTIIILCSVAVLIGGWYGYRAWLKARPYEPSAEFAEAYNTMEEACRQAEQQEAAADSPESAYIDLEQTVRIMNSLEVAQGYCGSFDELLLYMAKQDYTGVAPEILRAKQRMFPVLEQLHDLQSELDALSSPMSYLNAVSQRVEDNGISTSFVASANMGIVGAIDGAFKLYLEQQKMKKALRKELAKVNRSYIAYVEEYAPVYHKYMREWDKLCLLKDQAYIDCYSERYADALNNAEQILQQHPNNPEGLLLKSLALIALGPKQQIEQVQPKDIELNQRLLATGDNQYHEATLANPLYFTAERTLDAYIALYPDRAAPALMLKGMLNRQIGNRARAYALFEQAAIEYPRQADALTDILNAYNNRAHLTQTAEGLYLLNYYRSTMEGFGLFSPNFQKASLLIEEDRFEESQQEIYKHFFRRGNQAEHHCLLSDLQYCEKNLLSSFRPIFLESSYLDIEYEPSSVFLGIGSQKNHIDLTLNNRSDSRLENIRIFLCVHYTGMYTDDYTVIKIPQAQNIIEPYQRAEFEEIDLGEHETQEITRVRAIVMTDDKIGWVDTPELKLASLLQRNHSVSMSSAERAMQHLRYLEELNFDAPGIKSLLASEMRINGEPLQLKGETKRMVERYERDVIRTVKAIVKDYLSGGIGRLAMKSYKAYSTSTIELPRVMALFNPACTIYPISEGTRTIHPEKEILDGGHISLTYEHRFEEGEITPFFVYGNCIALRLDIRRSGDQYTLEKIEEI